MPNKDKSAASFCQQVAIWVSDMFCDFYLVKSHKIANNTKTSEPREKNKRRFRILKILEIFDVSWGECENNQILL
jgi:hypothetical protein